MRPILFVLICLLLLLPAAQPAFGAQVQAEELPPMTFWRVGFMLTAPPSAGNLANIPASSAARLESALPAGDHYFVLPVSTLLQVQNINLLVFDRSGSYSGTYSASVEVHSLSGGYQRTLSASSLNLQSAANNAWTTIPLSGDCRFYNDEVLVVHFQRDGASGGDLSLGVGLEATFQNLTFYLPIISR